LLKWSKFSRVQPRPEMRNVVQCRKGRHGSLEYLEDLAKRLILRDKNSMFTGHKSTKSPLGLFMASPAQFEFKAWDTCACAK
jgi:hypothetical protein